MQELLTKVLPLAVGAAISPMIVTVVVLILSTPTRPRLRAWAFTLGATLTLIAVSLVGAQVFHTMHQHVGRDPTGAAVKGVAALLLLVLAWRAWRAKPTAGAAAMQRLDGASTAGFIGIGALAMLANFSTLVLFIPAVREIVDDQSAAPEKLSVFAIALVVAMLPAWLPAALATILGPRADPLLSRVNMAVTRHSNQINMAICLIFALYLGYGAAQDLLG